jgi:MFS family permease
MSLGAVCAAALVLPLAFSGGTVATRAIGVDLGGDPGALPWITNAFMLSFGATLLAAGGLADQWGRRRLFLGGLALFTLAALAGAVAPSVPLLDLTRAIQGLGASAALASGTAALAQEFTGSNRALAFSLLGATFGMGLAFGPVLAGLVVEDLGWRSVFLAVAAVALVALAVGRLALRETRDPTAGGPDWAGAALFSAFLALLTTALIQGAETGWAAPETLALLALVPVTLWLFLRVETRRAHPLLDLSLFRDRRFLGVQALPMATCACYVVPLVLVPQRLIGVEGWPETAAGLVMIALSAPMLILPLLAARLSRHVSPARLSAAGLVVAAVGLVWLAEVGPGSSPWALAAPLLVIGAGTAFPWGLMDGLSVSVVPKERAGMAAGIFSTVRVAGEGLALAAVTAVLTQALTGRLSELAGAPVSRGAALALATGGVGLAAPDLPGFDTARLVGAHGEAFSAVVLGLAVVTVLAAGLVLALLDERVNPAPAP